MNANVMQMSDYQAEKTERPAIYSTIEQASADLDTAMGEVVPFQQSENSEPSDEDIDRWWEEAGEKSIDIVTDAGSLLAVGMLITHLVDTLRICDVSPSAILWSVQRGLEIDEDRQLQIGNA